MSDSIVTSYLILAHQWPAQLKRLINALQAPGVVFWVHVDASRELEPFTSALSEVSNCHFIEDRQAVCWGGFSQTQAILRLMTESLAAHANCHRFNLISGTCYPIADNDVLAKASASAFQFIACRRISEDSEGYKRISRYHLNDHRLLSVRDPGAASSLQKSLRSYVKAFVTSLPPPPPPPIPYHKGSTWWMLTRPVVEHVLSHCLPGSEILERFRYSAHADESLVQTLVANSPFAKSIRPDRHYVDWSPESRKRGKYLTIDALAHASSRHLFMRKVHPEISAELLDAADLKRASSG